MLSKSEVSFVKSLQQKKFRKEHGLFVAEGWKLVSEFIGGPFSIDTIFYEASLQPKLPNLSRNVKLREVSRAELERISGLQQPQDCLALIKTPEKTPVKAESFQNELLIALDGVQDPGNMGTIIRTADWFGISRIFCSEDSVEVYNPKVVQATMGSLARVDVQYTDLAELISEAKIPVYGALLNGASLYAADVKAPGFLLFGNEGKGISSSLLPLIDRPLTIPSFGGAESLNVAVSVAIFCSEAKRNSQS